MVVAALSTGHKIGLGTVALVFIAFALSSSFLAPRRKADFPGRNGLSVFVIASIALFVAMLGAVLVFGRESPEAKGAEKPGAAASGPAKTVAVSESEFKIALPAASEPAGKVAFVVHNVGKIPHDFAIQGGHVTGPTKTALIQPGGSATLTVSLASGSYTVYCTVPGHRAAGMVAKLTVG